MDRYIEAHVFGEISSRRWDVFMSTLFEHYRGENFPEKLPYDTYILRHQILAEFGSASNYATILMSDTHRFHKKIVQIIRKQPKTVIETLYTEIISLIYIDEPGLLLYHINNSHLIKYVTDEAYELMMLCMDNYIEATFLSSIVHRKIHCFKKLYITSKPENLTTLLNISIIEAHDFGCPHMKFSEIVDAFEYLRK